SRAVGAQQRRPRRPGSGTDARRDGGPGQQGGEAPMPRRLLVLSLLTLLLLAPASTAWARGDGWEPLNNQPFTVEACGTTVDAPLPMDQEYPQVTTDAEGNQHIKVTGALKVPLTDTATGRSVTYNISGPGTSIAHDNRECV